MNKIYIYIVSVLLGSTMLASCSDWTEDESLNINITEGPDYENYLNDLRNYKKTDHKYVYAWFDNSEKNPSSRGQHITSVPDSVDVVVLKNPRELAQFELNDIKELQNKKGTKVTYSIDYDLILSQYNQMVRDEEDKNGSYSGGDFANYLRSEVTSLLSISSDFDGIIIGNYGMSTVYMSEAEKNVYLNNQNILLNAVAEWSSANPNKMLSYFGHPQYLRDKSILSKCKHIILNTLDVTSAGYLSVAASQAAVDGVPTDRFVVIANLVSADPSDRITGYYGDKRALTEVAYWITENNPQYTKAGIAINNIQVDYYDATKRYKFVREAINIIAPAPIKK